MSRICQRLVITGNTQQDLFSLGSKRNRIAIVSLSLYCCKGPSVICTWRKAGRFTPVTRQRCSSCVLVQLQCSKCIQTIDSLTPDRTETNSDRLRLLQQRHPASMIAVHVAEGRSPLSSLQARCFGITTIPQRLAGRRSSVEIKHRVTGVRGRLVDYAAVCATSASDVLATLFTVVCFLP
jgi:hypothetical protein